MPLPGERSSQVKGIAAAFDSLMCLQLKTLSFDYAPRKKRIFVLTNLGKKWLSPGERGDQDGRHVTAIALLMCLRRKFILVNFAPRGK